MIEKIKVYSLHHLRLFIFFLSFSKSRAAALCISKILSAALFSASILVLGLFATSLESGEGKLLEIIKRFNIDVASNLPIIAIIIFIFFVAAGLINFLYSRLLLKTSIKLSLECVKKAYIALAVKPLASLSSQDKTFLIQRDPLVIGRIYRDLMDSIVGVPVVLIIVAVEAYLSTDILLGLLSVLAILCPFYAGLSMAAKLTTNDSEKLTTRFRGATRELRSLAKSSSSMDELDQALNREVSQGGVISQQYNFFYKKINSQYLATLISSLFLAFGVIAVLLIGTEEVDKGELSFSDLAIFILLLKPLYTVISSLANTVTLCARFYPNSKRFIDSVQI